MIEEQIVKGQIYLGKQGEDRVRTVQIPQANTWNCIYGEGTFELFHRRSGDEEPYKVTVDIVNGCGIWTVTMFDTAYAGKGQCELRYICDGNVVKSQICGTNVIALSDIKSDEDVVKDVEDYVGEDRKSVV